MSGQMVRDLGKRPETETGRFDAHKHNALELGPGTN